MLSLEGIGKFKDGKPILQGISFVQEPFQHIAIAGETGSGKSTLLKIIAGLVQPDEGLALLNGEKIKGPDDQLVPGHKGVGYLSQHFELRNNYWVHEILSYANRLTKAEADKVYAICQIDHLLGRRTHELSGGEKQRIATARLLINDPVLLLLDEPFSNLDLIHRSMMKTVIADITEQLKITTILVSHEPADILPWAHQLLLLKDGRVIQQGKPKDLYRCPVNQYCAGLLGAYNLLSAQQAQRLSGAKKPIWKNTPVMIRPEDFQITENGVEMTIVRYDFMGAQHLYHLDWEGKRMVMLMDTDIYSAGEKIKVGASSSSFWSFMPDN